MKFNTDGTAVSFDIVALELWMPRRARNSLIQGIIPLTSVLFETQSISEMSC
jgi:hypothetical protein